MTTKHRIFRYGNVVSLVAVLVVNYLASGTAVFQNSVGSISDALGTLITPADYAFSIWGIIYTGLFGLMLYQFFPEQRRNKRIEAIGPWFILNNLVTIVWLVTWVNELFVVQMVAMFGILATLIVIIARADVFQSPNRPPAEWLVLDIPFSLYTGWISVATVLSVSAFLQSIGWVGFGLDAQTWALIMVVVASVVAVGVSALLKGNVVYAMAIAWALFGISAATEIATLGGLSTGLAVAVLLLTGIQTFTSRGEQPIAIFRTT